MTIKDFKRSLAERRMIRSVVPEFSKWDPILPFSRTPMNKASKICLQTLINTYSLTVCLRVVGCTKFQMSTRKPEEFLPKVAGENSVTVRNDSLRQPMKFEYVIHVQHCYFHGSKRMGQWNKMGIFREFINYYQNAVAMLRSRKTLNKVQ